MAELLLTNGSHVANSRVTVN